MEKLRFKFTVLGSTDGKTNQNHITSIETPDGCVFQVPDELQLASKHTALVSSEVYTKVKNSLKKRHQTRSVWIPLTTDLRKIYLDDGGNIQFDNQYLEEITEKTVPSDTQRTNSTNGKAPEKLNIAKTAEKFLLEKYSNKTSCANQWISDFENECERFEIILDQNKIGILKHLLEKQCLDWYTSMLIKLTVNSEWSVWKANFRETYGNKGWSQIKYAFTYRFQAGSLLEYATKKERLLLEVNKYIDTQTMINLIVIGLPNHVMEKIDKEDIKTTSNLYNEIGKYEHVVNNNNFTKNKKYTYEYKGII